MFVPCQCVCVCEWVWLEIYDYEIKLVVGWDLEEMIIYLGNGKLLFPYSWAS